MRIKNLLVLPVMFLFIGIASCKKGEGLVQDYSKQKKQMITGSWKQKDLIISVSVKLGGQSIPAGTSMITLAPILGQALKNPAIAEGLLCTKNNVYTFSADNKFTIIGCTNLILPKAGNAGNWQLTVYDAVLQFTSEKGDIDPHWINSLAANNMQVALTLSIPNVGNLPLSLILEKQ